MKYPYRLYTLLKAPLYVRRLGLAAGAGLLRRLLTAPPGALIEAPVPGTQRHVLVRGQSSDRRCYEQIFISREYDIAYRGEPKLIIDGGANVGYASVYFATRFPDATVIAIEPEASNAALLRQNVAGLPKVEVIEGALWSSEDGIAIANPEDDKWSFTVRAAAEASEARVPGVTIASLLARAGEARVGILKLDIEGAEVEVLEDAQAWIDRVDQLVIELHPHKRPECREVFERAIAGRVASREGSGENEWVAFVA